MQEICDIVQHINMVKLTLCMMILLSSADFFPKSTFLNSSFSNTIRDSNSLDRDQARQNVGPDLGPNCLRRMSTGDTCRQGVNNGESK